MPRRITDGDMVYLALDQGTQSQEASAPVSEPETARAAPKIEDGAPGPINVEAVVEKVYQLMQRDLAIELERVTRLGG